MEVCYVISGIDQRQHRWQFLVLEMPVRAGTVEKTSDHEIRVGMRGFEVKTVLLTFGEAPDS